MAEKVTNGLEKVFFHHILDNPEQFYKVEAYFFKNEDIQFIYKVIRDDYVISKQKNTPSPQQILAIVKLNDSENKISNNLIKMLLKGDNSTYSNEWLVEKFKAWKISNLTKNNVLKSIEMIRGLEEINLENVVDVASKIKQIHNEALAISDDDEDLGDDFDDIESHRITSTTKKMSTGWSCMDRILNGGWDQASMNVIMGETNIGKCFFGGIIEIKNTHNGKIEKIKVEDFYNRIKYPQNKSKL